MLFFFNDTATTEIYTLSLHDALPICSQGVRGAEGRRIPFGPHGVRRRAGRPLQEAARGRDDRRDSPVAVGQDPAAAAQAAGAYPQKPMSHAIPALLLALCCVVGLLLVPLGLPGLWVMALGIIGYGWLTGFQSVGVATIAIVVGLALLAELVEWWLGFGLARRYGGARRAGGGGAPGR